MAKGNKKPTEDDLIVAILKVRPTADMPKYPKRKAKPAAKKRGK